MAGRITSLIIAFVYLIAAFFGKGIEGILYVLVGLLFPLACIWFPDELGSFTGVMRGQYINAKTPGCLVAFGGWLLLTLPLIIGIIYAASN